MNQASLDKILKVEVLVHTNEKLKDAFLILDYIPISNTFQAPKCIIKTRDTRLQRIGVAALGFLIINPIPQSTLATGLILEGIPKVTQPP